MTRFGSNLLCALWHFCLLCLIDIRCSRITDWFVFLSFRDGCGSVLLQSPAGWREGRGPTPLTLTTDSLPARDPKITITCQIYPHKVRRKLQIKESAVSTHRSKTGLNFLLFRHHPDGCRSPPLMGKLGQKIILCKTII